MIAIIPARGGSKGLPGKNIMPLSGKPMIAYSIEAALQSKYIDTVIVSTDDLDIYKIAIEFGATETFLRPEYLAQDDSLAIDNYLYTINRLKEEFKLEINEFVVLQPTSPLRISEDIDKAIEIFNEKKADSVVSYVEEHHPISWHKFVNSDLSFENIFPENLNNRQDNQPSYYPNGAIYVFNSKLIESRRYYSDRSYAYIMPRERSVDIDTRSDFNYAAFLLGLKNE